MAKMAASVVVESGEDVFRKMFKFYKRRDPPPDLREVTDFSSGAASGGKIVPVKLDPAAVSDEEAACVGLQPVRNWRAFGLQGYPGFIFISNPFLRGSQAFWVRQCLKTYPQKPNVCNLDMHMSPSDTQDIWARSVQALRTPASVKRQPKTLLERLRWVTLGYHYNWDTKVSLQVYFRTAVFKVKTPTAMFMHSGDVMLMSGQSRLLYHAVPRILPALPQCATLLEELSCASALQTGSVLEPVSQEDWDVCSRYIQSSRVNVTVRQVLGPGQRFPEEPKSALQPRDEGQTVGCHDDGNSGKRKRTCSDPVETIET
ncbi:nucleic acid dioxygenase ALKBH1 [Gambusia affinis]|uniref:nucleic acid dioxygenase ALKBH1 n=1 Tax=Gambusia affinis TaxID=33528 RepID=UPI001CDD5B76|nr:nucleic acid dioxygenase ALKBH1 [Gambusia affinis]